MHTLMLMMRVCLDVLYKRDMSYCNRLKISVNIYWSLIHYLFFVLLVEKKLFIILVLTINL